jgi:hypothetical protein
MRKSVSLTCCCAGVLLATIFVAHAQTGAQNADPISWPARDLHQGVLVAANPYVSADQYKSKFGKPAPRDAGILAIETFFRNDADSPVRIKLENVRLRIGAPGDSRKRLEAISPDDVADRTLLKSAEAPRANRLPFPLPGGGAKSGRDKNWEKFATLLRSLAMSSQVVPPHGTVRGFFYFDINDRFDWLPNASLDVPDLEFMVGNKPLFFFEVDLAPAIR